MSQPRLNICTFLIYRLCLTNTDTEVTLHNIGQGCQLPDFAYILSKYLHIKKVYDYKIIILWLLLEILPIFRWEYNNFSSVCPKVESWIWGVLFYPDSLFRYQQGLYFMICVIEVRASCSFKITFTIYSQQCRIFYKARCILMN